MPIKNGDTVSVQYVGTFSDGTEFDRSQPGSPLRFKVGSGQVIPGFDRAVAGREKGDAFSVTIPASDAYGERRPELLFPVPVERIPQNIKPEIGMMLHVGTDQGELEVVVCEINEKNIILDANHPMAGKDLTFALEIVSVE
ncbi:MAG: peptidylprolyl isomerase [Mailhella sp.]|nr:peptidylprolyl isomerase [Mailhella sp.]